jgi:hypothetical protein
MSILQKRNVLVVFFTPSAARRAEGSTAVSWKMPSSGRLDRYYYYKIVFDFWALQLGSLYRAIASRFPKRKIDMKYPDRMYSNLSLPYLNDRMRSAFFLKDGSAYQ